MRCYVTKYVLGLPSTAALIRELNRNPYIARACGVESPDAIPHESTLSRFMARLSRRDVLPRLKDVSRSLVRDCYATIPGSDWNLIERRLKRAKSHIDQFTRAIVRFKERGPYEVISQSATKVGDHVEIRVEAKCLLEAPPRLGLYVSEAIHHTRSAVDNAIWTLGRRYRCSKDLSFPIASDERDFPLHSSFNVRNKRNRQRREDLLKLPDGARSVIEDVQPYKRDYPESSALWMLNRLWNDDKHRVPIVIVSPAVPYFIEPVSWGEAKIKMGFPYKPNRSTRKGDTVVLENRIPQHLVPKDNLDVSIEPNVVFYEFGQFAFGPAVWILNAVYNIAREDIVDKLKPFLTATASPKRLRERRVQ